MGRGLRCWYAVAIFAVGCDSALGLQPAVPPDAAAIDPCPVPAFDSRRFRSGFGPVSWTGARSACQHDGYDVVVFDANDGGELANELTAGTLPFWVGVEFDGTNWVAIDGCAPALLWAAGEPSIAAPGACIVQTAGVNGMRSVDCTTMLLGPTNINVFCETPLPNAQCIALTSPSHSQYAPGNVGFVNAVTAGMTCAMMGTGWHVVEINSGAELDYVTQTYTLGQTFWVAATWDGLKWHSSTTCPQVFDWAQGQPSIDPNPKCVLEGNGMLPIDCLNSPGAGLVICEHNDP